MLSRSLFVVSLLILFCSPFKVFAQTTNYGFYYVSGSGEHGVWLAEKDQQGNWKRGKKILINRQFNGNAVDPDVLKLDDGRFRLYYYKGYFVTPPPPNYTTHEIYSAISNDGINYTEEGKVFELNGITDPTVIKLADNTFLLAVVRGQEISFAKSNDGKNFILTGNSILNGGIPELLKLDDGNVRLFYNGPGGIVSHLSTDSGVNWQKENGVRLQTPKFVADPSVIRLNDKWVMFVKGFNDTGAQNPSGHNVMMAESYDGYSFNLINQVLLDSASVPEGVIIGNTTDIKETHIEISPNDFVLHQNYPNPFNPTTVIGYQIVSPNPSKGGAYVTLKVYDALGREIATLVNAIKEAGIHHSTFSTLHYSLPSGVYYYRLIFSQKSQSKKMVLIK